MKTAAKRAPRPNWVAVRLSDAEAASLRLTQERTGIDNRSEVIRWGLRLAQHAAEDAARRRGGSER